ASLPQLRKVPVEFERFRVGERLLVLHLPPVYDVAHGKLGDLAGLRARNVGHGDDAGRYVAWAGTVADLGAYLLFQRFVERHALGKPHEQDHADVALPLLADADCLDHLGQLLHLLVDLGRADAHAAGIQRGVGAAVDDHAAVLGPLCEVAVMPDIVEALEIGGVILLPPGIIPEGDRHGGEGARAHQLALFAP